MEDLTDDDSFTSKDVVFFEKLYAEVIIPAILISNGKPALLCYDGEFAQVEATSTVLLLQLIKNKKIELLKLPAGSTMLYQPNDLMRTHCIIHRYVHSDVFVKNTSQFQEAEPIWMGIVKNTLKLQRIPAASRNIFLPNSLFLRFLEMLLP